MIDGGVLVEHGLVRLRSNSDIWVVVRVGVMERVRGRSGWKFIGHGQDGVRSLCWVRWHEQYLCMHARGEQGMPISRPNDRSAMKCAVPSSSTRLWWCHVGQYRPVKKNIKWDKEGRVERNENDRRHRWDSTSRSKKQWDNGAASCWGFLDQHYL